MSKNVSLTVRHEVPSVTKRGGIGLDILWVFVILAGFLFFTSLVPLTPNDFWWHLKTGEYIYTNHAIPTTNIYAWTLPSGQPFYYAAWLAELLLYLLYLLDKLPLIIFARTLLIAIAMWLVASEAHRRSGSWRISALVMAMLSLMITNNLLVRTQMFAWIPFVVTYIILKRYTDGIISWRWLLLCPLSMTCWVNVHGSFILGLILPGAFFVGEAVQKLLRQDKAVNWTQIGFLGSTGVLSGLVLLINPRFTGIVSYTINMLTNPPSQQLIEEWQSPSPHGLSNITFFLSILILILAFAYTKYRASPTEIILVVGFLWLAWSGQRYVIWYGMLSMPLLARLIKDLPIRTPAFVPQKNWLNLGLAILVFIPTFAVQPWFIEQIPLPATYSQQVLRGSSAGPLLDIHTPVEATDYLRSHPGGHLFNEMGYGSYLIWALPKQGVFVDPRVELYPYDQWMDYIHIINGTNYDQLMTKYGADRILLDKNLEPSLASALRTDPLWTLEYQDRYAQIWSRVTSP
jgi:hypothetical protein